MFILVKIFHAYFEKILSYDFLDVFSSYIAYILKNKY